MTTARQAQGTPSGAHCPSPGAPRPSLASRWPGKNRDERWHHLNARKRGKSIGEQNGADVEKRKKDAVADCLLELGPGTFTDVFLTSISIYSDLNIVMRRVHPSRSERDIHHIMLGARWQGARGIPRGGAPILQRWVADGGARKGAARDDALAAPAAAIHATARGGHCAL